MKIVKVTEQQPLEIEIGGGRWGGGIIERIIIIDPWWPSSVGVATRESLGNCHEVETK